MRYIHSEERLPIPENGEHPTCPCSVLEEDPDSNHRLLWRVLDVAFMSRLARRIIFEGILIEDLEANSIPVV